MEATKYTVTITAQALSIDSIPYLIQSVINSIESEIRSGMSIFDDGDEVRWETITKRVSF